jgi:preprotein translocase subunit SecG
MILLYILFFLICLFLAFMVVITPSSEGGMAAAFGGMGSETFFGTKAHQHINKFTVFLAVAFLVLAIVINKVNVGHVKSGGKGEIERRMKNLPTKAPAGPPELPQPPPPKPPQK